MSSIVRTVVLVFAVSCIISARNAADLKADFASILPAGKKVRMAWIKGGDFAVFPENAKNTVVYVVDSDTGIIRALLAAPVLYR